MPRNEKPTSRDRLNNLSSLPLLSTAPGSKLCRTGHGTDNSGAGKEFVELSRQNMLRSLNAVTI